MSNLSTSVVTLDKGLDLQTAKIVAPPGSVLDTLNYEQVDFQGQKRIDGYARYDGRLLPALDDFYYIDSSKVTNTGGLLKSLTGVILGIELQTVGTEVSFAVINENLISELGAVSARTILTPEAHYDALLIHTQTLRFRIGKLPGATIGLHWFRDRLYAVADVVAIFIPNGNPVFPNDVIEGIRVLDVKKTGTDYLVYLDSMPAGATFNGTSFYSSNISVEASEDIASFFESRTEQQATTEGGLPGWRFKHLGWRVMFTNGETQFGDLAALNQNRTGVGVQGPTSISGNSGRPLSLTQAVNINGAPAQVNGWKSSTNRTSYSLSASDLADDDNIYTYADAFITWDGTTGNVEAPGSDMSNLTEYPATNTVVVDI